MFNFKCAVLSESGIVTRIVTFFLMECYIIRKTMKPFNKNTKRFFRTDSCIFILQWGILSSRKNNQLLAIIYCLDLLKISFISSPGSSEKFWMVAPNFSFPMTMFESEYEKTHRSFSVSNRKDHHILLGSSTVFS